MNAAATYLATAIAVLETRAATQADPIDSAAESVAESIARGGRVYVAATSHVLHTELYLRAGGLAAIHPLGEAPDLARPMLDLGSAVLLGDGDFVPEPGDVVLVGTNAGTDAGTVQVAVAAKQAGCTVVGLTCVAYERWPKVVVEHPSGAKLVDIADIVIDIGGTIGDGVVDLPGLDTAVGPTSGVALCAAAWAILVGAAERLLERGLTPIVYRSVQVPGAEDLFHQRRASYGRTHRGVFEAGVSG
ncbi:MAG: sugar isomerase domain-containing protein [Candidatus Limnocylindrales bacterium]